MEIPAIELGIASDAYWEMTFDEIMVQVLANKNNRERELKEKAMFDYNQAQLMMYAVNDPSKMPAIDKMYPWMADKPQHKVVQPVKEDNGLKPYIAEMDQAILLQMVAGVKRTQDKKNN